MIKAIFFDFDETLFSTSGIGSKLLKEVLKETNLKFDQKKYKQVKGLNMQDKLKILYPKEHEKLFKKFSKQYDVEFILHTKPFFGAIDAVNEFTKRGIKLFIFSTKKLKYIKQALEKYGIANLFIEIIAKDNVALPKPNPIGLNIILSKYSLKKSDCVIVGDSVIDEQSALNAQLKFIQINHLNEEKLPRAIIKVNKFSELVKFIEGENK